MKPHLTIAAMAVIPLALAGCEIGLKDSEQSGYRGTGGVQITPAGADAEYDVPAPPYDLPEDTGGPRAGEVYENVQVLGDVSVDEFNYIMAAITEWVSPDEGCNYCHNPANMASDEIYTKHVSRKMIQMTQALNGEYQSHVGQTGVTCYTCHRGNNIPEYVWSNASADPDGIVGNKYGGQNGPNPSVGYASLPSAGFYEAYLGGEGGAARVQSEQMHPGSNPAGTKDAENQYAIMMHLSQSLGVNCTYCHNTQAFGEWGNSGGARATAWHGLQMVKATNREYIDPLQPVFPDYRLGDEGDPLKVNCQTCHQGANKPLGGAQMAKDYPSLQRLSVPAGLSLVPSAEAAEALMLPESRREDGE